jgi:DNA-binding transcriptional MerR regulator
MTIREIENMSGMTRANIRYYEHEGLLAPARADNDYRDYSEADLATLLKIKLLRQLQVPLDDIRKLQAGSLALSDALDEKLRQLELDMTGLQYSAEICRDIRASNITYTSLDAQKYLDRTVAAAQLSPQYFSIRSDELPRVSHPWRRYFARSLDYTLYSVLWSAVAHILLRWNTSLAGLLEEYILALISFGLMLLLEPALLSTWGTTPGKWIFGLEVRSYDGTKLSYSGALWRSWEVFHHGYGYFIPFYNLYRNYKSYKACRDGEELPWDEDVAYTLRDTNGLRIAGFLGAYVLFIAIEVFVLLQAEMPRHRGELTAAEFTQNFNDLMDYNGIHFNEHLDVNGKWTQNEADRASGIIVGGPELPAFSMTETDGVVTKVSLVVTDDQQSLYIYDYTYTNLINLALKSYVCAQKGVNFLNQNSVVTRDNTAFKSFSYTKAGVTVNCSVDYEGYRLTESGLLFPDNNEKQYYHLEFTMEKAV